MKLKNVILLVILLLSMALPVFAAIPYRASDLVGQTELLDDNAPVFERDQTNNGYYETIFAEGADVEVDTVNHRLFVSDTGSHRIMVFNLDNSNFLVDRVADNVLGQSDFVENFDSHTSFSGTGQGQFEGPDGIAFDSNNNRLFVSDTYESAGTSNNRILVFDTATITDGENAVNVLGQIDFSGTSAATTQGGLSTPRGLAYNTSNNHLYVADTGNSRVLVFDVAAITDGENAINVLGQLNFTSSGGATTQGRLSTTVRDVEIDVTGNRLFVSDSGNSRIMVFDVAAITDGENAVNVLGQTLFTLGVGAVAQGRLDRPRHISYDGAATQRLFVADAFNNRVMVFDVTAITDGENAINVLGKTVFNNNSFPSTVTAGTFQRATTAEFVPGTNLLYVLNGGNTSGDNRMNIFDVAAITDGEDATDMLGTLNRDLTAYFNGFETGPGELGFGFFTTDAVVDTVNHRLFVADGNNNRVMVFELDTENDLDDHEADFVLGQPDFTTISAGVTQSKMERPKYLEFDEDNNRLFVSDARNGRVLVYDTTTITNGENAANVLGQINFTTDSACSTTAGIMCSTTGLAYDGSTEKLYVGDDSDLRVLVFDVLAITDGEDAVNVLGAPNLTTSGNGGNAIDEISNPLGMDIDETNGRLFIADSFNSRVMVFDVNSITDGEDSVATLGIFGGPTPDSLDEPVDVAYDPVMNQLFVYDIAAWRVVVYDTEIIVSGENAISVIGQPDLTSDDAPADPTLIITDQFLDAGNGIAFDSVGRKLYVADSSTRVIRFDLINQEPDSAIADGTEGIAYSENLTTNSQGAVTHNLDAGTLPPGLAMNANVLSGTPTLAGVYNFTVTSIDTVDTEIVFSDTADYSITIAAGAGGGGGGTTRTGSTRRIPTFIEEIFPAAPPTSESNNQPENTTAGQELIGPRTETKVAVQEENIPSQTETSSEEESSVSSTEATSESQNNQRRSILSSLQGLASRISLLVEEPFIKAVRNITVAIPGLMSLIALFASINSGAPLINHLSYFSTIILQVAGMRRPKPWGVVYDSYTKKPLPFARVEVLNRESRKLETTVADESGRYGFLVSDVISQESSKHLSAYQNNYIFPSAANASVAEKILYLNIYKGGPINDTGNVISLDLPMDPVLPRNSKIFNFGVSSLILARALSKIIGLLFLIGLILSIIFLLVTPNFTNILFIALVAFISILRKSGLKLKPFGLLKDAEKNQNMPFGFLALQNSLGQRINFTVSDSEGRYFLLSPKGQFLLRAHTPSYISPMRTKELDVATREGWIGKKISF